MVISSSGERETEKMDGERGKKSKIQFLLNVNNEKQKINKSVFANKEIVCMCGESVSRECEKLGCVLRNFR